MNARLVCTFALVSTTLPLFSAEEEAVTVFQRVSPSVVGLESVGGNGTGILLNKDGTILTNAHVVAVPLPFKCLVDVAKGTKTETIVFQKVKVVGVHPKLDLAIVKIDPAEHSGAVLRPATINKTPAMTGQRVYAIGNPGSRSNVKLTKTVTSGLLSGVDRQIDDVSYLQISAPINPGNSGGPLCDKTGKVIGVVTLKLTDVENVGFALPITELKADEFKPLRERVASPEKAGKILSSADKLISEINRLKARGQGKTPQAELYRVLAIQIMHEALLLDASNGTVYSAIAGLLDDFEEYAQAEAYFVAGLEASPWTPDSRIYRNFGRHMALRKRPEDAIAIWGEGLAKHPHSSAVIWEDLAIVHRSREEWLPATRCATVVALMNDPGTRRNLALDIGGAAFAKTTAAEQEKLKLEMAQMGDELLRRLLVRNAHLQHPRAVLTKPFADLLARNHWSLPEGTPTNAKPAPIATPRVIDLLAGSKAGFGGDWPLVDGARVSPAAGTSRWDAVAPETGEEYDLLIEAERLKGKNDLTLGLMVRGQPAAVVIDFNGSITGVAGLKTPLVREPVLPANWPVSLVVKVRKSSVTLRVNERDVLTVDQTGPLPNRSDAWNGAAAADWFIGSHDASFAVHGWWIIKQPPPGQARTVDILTPSPMPPVTPPSVSTTPGTNPPPAPQQQPGQIGPTGLLEIKQVAQLPDTGWGMKSLAFTADGKFVAGGKTDNAVWIFDVAKNAKVFDTGRLDDLNDVCPILFSPQGDKLLAGSRNGKIRVWNFKDGMLLHDRDYVGHGGEVMCMNFSADGKFVLSGARDERLRLWELANGREHFAWADFKSGPKACRFLPNGDAVATDGQSLFKINIKEGRADKASAKLASYTSPAAISPDGSEVAVVDTYAVRRWSVADFTELPKLPGNESLWSVQYSPDGKRIITGGRGNFYVWDTGEAKFLDEAMVGELYVKAIAVTPNGKRFASICDAAGQTLRIYDSK